MKKVFLALLFVSALGLTACHYGQEEAQKTLDRNELYKGDRAGYSVNRAGDYGKMNESKHEADTAAAPVDSAAADHVAAPAHGE